MAKEKKTKVNNGELKFDSELNFDFDDSFDIGNNSGSKKKRKPIVDVLKGVKEGAKSKLKSASFWQNVAKKALPDSYTVFSEEIGKTKDILSDAYRESAKALRPDLHRIGRQIDSLVPEEAKRIKKLSSRLNRKDPYTSRVSSESLETQAIIQAQSEIFQQGQAHGEAKEARERAEQRIRDKIDSKRFDVSANVLGNINEGIQRISAYTTSVNSSWQKKSLELQYRSYFVQSELLKTTNKYNELFKAQLEAIQLNTSLPEFVKITNTERFKEMLINKSFSGIQKGLAAGAKRAGARLKGYAQQFSSGLSSASMALDMVGTARDSGMSGANMVGQLGGSELMNYLGTKAGKKISKHLPKGTKEFVDKWAKIVKDPTEAINKLQGGQFNQGMLGRGGFLGGFFQLLNEFAGDFKTPKLGKGLIGSKAAGALEAHPFTDKAHKSIVEVIPGFLARILQEQTAIRLKSKKLGKLPVYSWKSGKFTDDKGIQREIRKDILNTYRRTSGDESYKKAAMMNVLAAHDKDGYREHLLRAGYMSEEDDGSYSLNVKKAEHLHTKHGQRLTDNRTPIPKPAGGFPPHKTEPGKHDDIGPVIGYTYNETLQEYQKTSDRNVKTNISSTKGGFLEKLKKLGTYRFNYRKGQHDDGQQHQGYMAQDVKKTFGDKAAPGGTKIDESFMTSANTEAIKELHKEQSKQLKGDDAIELLKSIDKRLSEMTVLGKFSIGLNPSEATKGLFGDTVRLAGKYTLALGQGAVKGGKFLGAAGGMALNTAKGIGGVMKNTFDRHKGKIGEGIHGLIDGVLSLTGLAYNTTKGALGMIPKGIKFLKNAVDSAMGGIKSFLSKPRDFYLPGFPDKPILQGNLFSMGAYFDDNGKPILTLEDLKKVAGNVRDKGGEVIVTSTQLAEGLVDKHGTKLKHLITNLKGIAIGAAGYIGANLIKGLGKMKDALSAGLGFAGKVGAGAGRAASGLLGKLGLNFGFGDINKNIGKILNLLLKWDKNGMGSGGGMGGGPNWDAGNLGDPSTNAAAGTGGPADGFGAMRRAKGWFMGAKNALTSDRAKSIYSRIGKTKGMQRLGGLGGGRVGRAAGSIGGFLGGAAAMFGNKNQAPGDQGPQQPGNRLGPGDQGPQKPGTPGFFSKMMKKIGIKPRGQRAWNDTEGTGERAGSWRTKLEEQKERDANKAKSGPGVVEDARYRNQDKGEGILSKLTGVFGILRSGMGMLFNVATGILAGGVLSKAGSGLMKVLGGGLSLGKGLVVGAGTALAAGAGAVAKGAGQAAGGIKGVLAKIFGMGALKGIAKQVPVLGTLLGVGFAVKRATEGDYGGAGLELLSTVPGFGLAANAALIYRDVKKAGKEAEGGATSGDVADTATQVPAKIGLLAMGPKYAVAYGGYKAIKFLSRDSLDEYQSFRYMQYGFGTKSTESYNHKLYNIEMYLDSDKMKFDKDGKASIKDKSVDLSLLAVMMDVDPEVKADMNKFKEWYVGRFKPFFLNTITALYTANNNVKLSQITKLTPEERIKFLKACKFDSGPYDVSNSPIPDIPYLPSNKNEVMTKIDIAIKEQRLEAQKEEDAANKPSYLEAVRDRVSELIEKAFPIPPPDDGKAHAAELSRHRAEMEKFKAKNKVAEGPVGEDTETTKQGGGGGGGGGTPQASTGAGSIGTKPILAPGGLADGSSGMQYVKLYKPSVDLQGLNPSVLKNFLGMAQEYGQMTGKTIQVNSAYRSIQEQALLKKKDPTAAAPGGSMHGFGLAMDIQSSDLNALEEAGLLRKYGFTRPVGQEPWHLEPAGVQRNIGLAKSNATIATQMVDAGLLKGGGGQGTVSGVAHGSRNPEMQMALLNMNSSPVDAKTTNQQIASAIAPAANDSSFKPQSSETSTASNSTATTRNKEFSYTQNNRAGIPLPAAVTADIEKKPSVGTSTAVAAVSPTTGDFQKVSLAPQTTQRQAVQEFVAPTPSSVSNRTSDTRVESGASPMAALVDATRSGLNIQQKQLDTMIEIRDMIKTFVSMKGGTTKTPAPTPASPPSNEVITPIVNISRNRSGVRA